ncbi:MAG: TSUP family transporter [Amylibacter sp.]
MHYHQYFALSPNLTDLRRKPLIPTLILTSFLLPVVGFYDGIFGPGAGSFYMLMLLSLGGMGILQATAQTKFFNFASNFGGFIGFALIGAISWKVGFLMAAGQIIGSTLGARLAMKKGAQIIKPLLVTICIATALKLLLSN